MFKNNRGFSLIEVLVTVGLIGILVGIAIPSYSKYKKNTLSMAIKADVANGHKAYSAYHANSGDFCTTLEDAGINVIMTSSTYRKAGYYGFGAIDVDCGGTPSDLKTLQKKSKGYCQDDTSMAATSDDKMACDTATMKTWQAVNQFSGTVTVCKLGADDFTLGAYTKTSGLDTFFVINASGKSHQNTGDTCPAVP